MTIQERFMQDTGLSAAEVRALMGHANYAALCNTRACNGDPFPVGVHAPDKNRNAAAWEKELDKVTEQMTAIVVPHGLKVDYTGLRPCLRDSKGRYLEIPH